MTAQSSSRLDHVDAIRGVAALSVVIFHALLWYPDFLIRGIGSFLDIGKFGVVLFFMVSGFVVPFSFQGTGRAAVRDFAIRRLLRLYPAYWLSIACAIVAGLVVAQPFKVSQLLVNLTMLQALLGIEDVLPVYWTLLIELIFYGVCAGLFFLGLLRRVTVLGGLSFACLLAALPMAFLRWRSGLALPVALPLSLSLMLSAALWRHYLRDGSTQARRLALALFGLSLTLMPLIALLAYNRHYGAEETWYRYSISYFVAVTAFLLFTTCWRLGGPLMIWLGQISYSIYLFHGIVLRIYGNLVRTGQYTIVHIGAYLLLTLALSHIVFVFVEKPFIRWGRLLTGGQRFSRRDAVI